MSRVYLTHASLVLPDLVLNDASLFLEDGQILAINPTQSPAAQEIDLRGQYLLPGLVDLHCDAIEKEAEPRVRVHFPLDFAVAQVDRRNAAAGVTTPFHAISFGGEEHGMRNNKTAVEIATKLRDFAPYSLVDNRIHCRFEVTIPSAEPVLTAMLEAGVVDLLSVMDHSPGQGQFKTLEAYLQYAMSNHGMTREQAGAIAQKRIQARDQAGERITRLLTLARSRGVATASHDDDSIQRIALMRNLGVSMSEFPINLDTAKAAVSCGLPTVLGAPNVVRGQSQSGSMRAIDAIRAGVASCLCSDYQPSTLIAAVFAAHRQSELTLPQAVALASANPAAACGLNDRGRIAVGLRADLIAVATVNGLPLVTRCWSAGREVFSTHYAQADAVALLAAA